MRSDDEIKTDVEGELKWGGLSDAGTEVEVRDGEVRLRGKVDSLAKKLRAEEAAHAISGVKRIVNELEIAVADSVNDQELEEAIGQAIRWNSDIDKHKLEIEVRGGWVTLKGKVDWEYQRARARQIAEGMKGVRGVANLIMIHSGLTTPENIKERIQSALKRNYYLRSNSIHVTVKNNKAVLKGKVRTLSEKTKAESAAWSAPGIIEVDNQLEVSHSEIFAHDE